MRLPAYLAFLFCALAGCAGTQVRTHSGETYAGSIVSSDEQSITLRSDDEHTSVPRSDIARVRHPGQLRVAGGMLLTLGSLIGVGVTAHSLSTTTTTEVADPVTGATRFEQGEAECGFCVLGFTALPVLSVGTAMLFRGIALQRESRLQLNRPGTRWGSAHVRIGASLLATSVATLAWLPALLKDEGAVRATGIGTLMTGTALVLPGVFLLARGLRMRRSTRVRLTARGLEF
ncbi:MAG: hypothetical protein AAF411_22925 [Myxococcota bacterium]